MSGMSAGIRIGDQVGIFLGVGYDHKFIGGIDGDFIGLEAAIGECLMPQAVGCIVDLDGAVARPLPRLGICGGIGILMRPTRCAWQSYCGLIDEVRAIAGPNFLGAKGIC